MVLGDAKAANNEERVKLEPEMGQAYKLFADRIDIHKNLKDGSRARARIAEDVTEQIDEILNSELVPV